MKTSKSNTQVKNLLLSVLLTGLSTGLTSTVHAGQKGYTFLHFCGDNIGCNRVTVKVNSNNKKIRHTKFICKRFDGSIDEMQVDYTLRKDDYVKWKVDLDEDCQAYQVKVKTSRSDSYHGWTKEWTKCDQWKTHAQTWFSNKDDRVLGLKGSSSSCSDHRLETIN